MCEQLEPVDVVAAPGLAQDECDLLLGLIGKVGNTQSTPSRTVEVLQRIAQTVRTRQILTQEVATGARLSADRVAPQDLRNGRPEEGSPESIDHRTKCGVDS